MVGDQDQVHSNRLSGWPLEHGRPAKKNGECCHHPFLGRPEEMHVRINGDLDVQGEAPREGHPLDSPPALQAR